MSSSPVSLAMEAMGDITASAEVSRVAVEGVEFESRIQGGVLVGFFLLDRPSLFSQPCTIERRNWWFYFRALHRYTSVHLRTGEQNFHGS